MLISRWIHIPSHIICSRRICLALLGLGAITLFVLIRAVGFHHIDRLIGARVAVLRVNWLLELGGIGLFILGALLALSLMRRDAACR
jgi:hypothetical protein